MGPFLLNKYSMDTRYIKLSVPIELEKYSTQLLTRSGNYRDNPINPQLLFSIVPKLEKFNSLLNQEGLTLFKPKTMTVPPGDWNPIHIDSSTLRANHPISLGLNFPIKNGPSSITRWYDFKDTGIGVKRFFWATNKGGALTPELYAIDPQEVVDRYAVDSMQLDGCYLFFSGQPHNVDSRHSKVWRSMLSIRICYTNTPQELVGWSKRHYVEEIINRISLLL